MIRFSILAGVSTDPQAHEDKSSIDDQVKTCRRVIEHHGGVEVACFVFDGYSRSGYDSLAAAMQDIPPLKDAIEAAEANKYDVLLLDNWDRLGDLGQLVYTRFRRYKKQIYSARQSGKLYDPKTYDPYQDESSGIDMHIQGIIQTYRINKIRRGWQLGVPARVERGLHPLSLPFGYRLSGKDQPAQIVPEESQLLVKLKNWMLEGMSYEDMTRRANDSGVGPRRAKGWSRHVVKSMVLNPFYAGIVRFGKLRGRIQAPKSEWKLGNGKHMPLWDEATHRALLAEAKRRLDGKRNFAAKYPFSGIPVCGICGRKISKHGKPPFEYMACDTHSHWSRRYEKAIDFLTKAVIEQFHQWQAAPHESVDVAPLEGQLADVRARRARIQEGYETSLYTAQEAAAKLKKVEADEERILLKLQQAEEDEANWQDRQQQRQDIDIEQLPALYGNPAEANHLLSTLIEKIVLTGDNAIVVWRD